MKTALIKGRRRAAYSLEFGDQKLPPLHWWFHTSKCIYCALQGNNIRAKGAEELGKVLKRNKTIERYLKLYDLHETFHLLVAEMLT